MKPRKIYVASSWRNTFQPKVVDRLRADGHEVYDFKNPAPGNFGFSWSEIDPFWKGWTAGDYQAALNHPIAELGFAHDFAAMKWADTFVLVMPCGRSAHLEMGWACGQGKETVLLLDPTQMAEPELMVKMCDHICTNIFDVQKLLKPFSASSANSAVNPADA